MYGVDDADFDVDLIGRHGRSRSPAVSGLSTPIRDSAIMPALPLTRPTAKTTADGKNVSSQSARHYISRSRGHVSVRVGVHVSYDINAARHRVTQDERAYDAPSEQGRVRRESTGATAGAAGAAGGGDEPTIAGKTCNRSSSHPLMRPINNNSSNNNNNNSNSNSSRPSRRSRFTSRPRSRALSSRRLTMRSLSLQRAMSGPQAPASEELAEFEMQQTEWRSNSTIEADNANASAATEAEPQ